MADKKIVVVGGVAGGATAAARLRRLDESAEITIVERGSHVSYANCGLPYYIGGVIREKKALMLQTPQSLKERYNLDVRVDTEAVRIDRDQKQLFVKEMGSGDAYILPYDKLLLSPGAAPVKPPIAEIEAEGVFTLRSLSDSFAIREYIDANKPKRAVVVGGGYIGVEMAENLVHAGIEVSIVEMAGHVIAPLDGDMAAMVQKHLKEKGIALHLGEAVKELKEKDGTITVVTNKRALESELVILSIGVRPDTILAAEAGLSINARGAIVVNERMETSDPDIYAVGDAVQIRNFVSGQEGYIPLAGPANKQARIAANNIAGIPSAYKGTQGSAILQVFDLSVATTGLNEGAAEAAGIEHFSVHIAPYSHATYYPGAQQIFMKGVFEKGTGRLLGAQVIGPESADKRIDVLATAIRANMTADDLGELELSYAPPFSSPKDPANILGFVAQNMMADRMKSLYVGDVKNALEKQEAVLLDARTKSEFDAGHIQGALNIPVDELRERMDELDKSKPVYVNCKTGQRSYIACGILSQRGYDCYNLSGGYDFYKRGVEE